MRFFDDSKRAAIRERKNVGFLTDFLVRSESSDYYRLRLLFNSVIGFAVALLLYHVAWNSLNFGAFNETYSTIIQTIIVGSSTYAFATSPIFRCALFCVLIGSFGKQGQYPFTMLVASNLHDGPISNMMSNYETTSDIVVCHIDLQGKIVANRVALMTGPLQKIIEQLTTKGTRSLRNLAKGTRTLLSPFTDLLADGEEPTMSEKMEELEKEQVVKIERRKEQIARMWEKSLGRKLTPKEELAEAENLYFNETYDERPAWMRFKGSIVQKFAAKLQAKCEEMFNKGVDLCRDSSTNIQDACRDAIIWPVSSFICPKLTMENMCDTASRKVNGVKKCRAQLGLTNTDPSLEHDIEDVIGLADELDKNSQISLHTIKVEGSRLAIEYRLSDLKVKVKAASLTIKGIFGISKQLFQALFIYFIYTIFRDAVKMIKKYRDDVDFNNCYVTREFWLIDKHRDEMGQTHISRITKQEKNKLKIMGIFNFPTGPERRNAIRPFFKWFCLLVTVFIICVLDHFLYSFLDSVIESSVTQVKQKSGTPSGLHVSGDGVIAEFMRTMATMNETLEIDRTLSNEHCLTRPNHPDTTLLICWLVLPLIFSFVFQVIFSFAIRRLLINFFFPFMFPRRSRTRLVHFYNKLLMHREKNRKEARARVRFMTDRRRVQTQQSNNFLTAGTFLRTQIFDRLFKTSKCFLCQERNYPRRLKYCADLKCQSSFCKDCIADNFGKCYACMVTRKEVTDERSKLLAPSEAGKEDEFLVYKKYLEVISKVQGKKVKKKKTKKKTTSSASSASSGNTTTTTTKKSKASTKKK